MSEWDELADRARREPLSKAWLAMMHEAIDLADAAGATDDAFDLRMEVVRNAHHVGEPLASLTAFAWCQARFDAEPDRFADNEYLLDWYRKWMPGRLTNHESVPLERLVAMIDDVEQRHVAAGNGRRQALALRMDLCRETGEGGPLEDLLADWRASARSSLSDCAACEALDEARALIRLDRDGEAAALLIPFVQGDRPYCGEGPTYLCTEAAEVLLDDHLDLAREAFHRALRTSMGDPASLVSTCRLTALCARTGGLDLALTLVRAEVAMLAEAPSPLHQMEAAAFLARALASFDDDTALDLAPETIAMLHDVLATPADLSTAAGLGGALADHARAIAARFDARNATPVQSDIVAEVLAAPERLDRPLEEPADPVAAPADGASAAPRGQSTVSASQGGAPDADPGSAPLDAVGFNEWCKDLFDGWRIDVVIETSLAVLADPSTEPARRAAAAIWAAGIADFEIDGDLLGLVDDQSIAVSLRARMASQLALSTSIDEDAAAALAHRAAELAEAPDLDADVRVGVVSRLGWWALERGDIEEAASRLDEARHLREQVAELDPGIAGRVDRLAFDVARRTDEELDALVAAARAMAEGARNSLPRSWAAMSLLEAGRALAGTGLDAEAAPLLAETAAAMAGFEHAMQPRYSALLTLADCEMGSGRPTEAMAAQRQAIELVRAAGGGAALGWARRGLGFQLRSVGRLDEAIVQFAEAADLLRLGGDPVEAAAVDLARARTELDVGEPDRADRLAERVLPELVLAASEDDADHDLLGRMRLDALEVGALARSRRGDHRGAAERWLELAAEQEPDPAAVAWNRSAAASEMMREGDIDEAVAVVEASIEDLARAGSPDDTAAIVLERAARVYAAGGRWEEASGHAAQARAHAESLGDPVHITHLRCLEADLLWDREMPAEARAHLLETAGFVDAQGLDGWVGEVHGRLADLCDELGLAEEAAAHQARIEAALES